MKMTFDEYFKSVNDKGIDFDGNYGVQTERKEE